MKIVYPLKREKYITQHFGENPDYYSQFKIGGVSLKGHEGIDLRAENGTPVLACDAGFCQEALDQGNAGYGKYIKIIHDWGESVYAHLQEFKIKQGAQVSKGQTIGLSDNTGNSSGPHLHFGLRINPYKRDDGWGGYSDPEPYLFGETTNDLDMPKWAKNLQPFFIENNLKDDQIESAVREAFGDRKILDGFIQKWIEKFNKPEVQDLGGIENEIDDLLKMEDEHIDLVSACEIMVGSHFESEKALREAIRAFKTDMDEVVKVNKVLTEEVETLKKKKVLDRYTESELLIEVFNKLLNRIRKKMGGGKNG